MSAAVAAYSNKVITFKFRGVDFRFALSQGLFSSAEVDAGTLFLLRVLSKTLDEDLKRAVSLPRFILDAGSGTGIMGICAAKALSTLTPAPRCRAQDRDELARLFTEYNARLNGLEPPVFETYAEPLLGGPPDSRWDLILSNIPAKAGKPVLLDFVSRSAGLLNPGGRVLVVVVAPLAELFQGRIGELGLPLLYDEAGKGHRVFMYGPFPEGKSGGCWGPVVLGGRFPALFPAYSRGRVSRELEGTAYAIEAVQGSAGFDSPGEAAREAAKLAVRLGSRLTGALAGAAVLIHEPGQGHFPVWLARYLEGLMVPPDCVRWVFSGRNILGLEAARHNMAAAAPVLVPAPDIGLGRDALAAAGMYRFIVLFPEPVPQTDRMDAHWEGLAVLLEPGGVALAAFSASEAERFDRKKPKGFRRLGEIRRRGFRALAYERG